jgi:UDP-N-acetylglucosamine 2-epimerase (non-hydrolysing)
MTADLGGGDHHRLLLVVGTRPEIIKMSPVVRALDGRDDVTWSLVHTDQHYDAELSEVFFETLGLPDPDDHLAVGTGTQAEQTAAGLTGVDRCIERYDPNVVLAQGDTNAVLATALAASKRETLFAHVEAGIRSGDESMPEEVNRRVADEVADLRFAPTETAAGNLAAAGMDEGVHVVGNTVVDACRAHVDIAARESDVRDRLGLADRPYAVATVHRPLNADSEERLWRLLDALDAVSEPVVLPVHPRAEPGVADWESAPDGSLRVVEPLDYLAFLDLLRNASAVVTDSGGVQEEASIVETPCLTVRPNTERPETVAAGVNDLVEPGVVHDRLQRLLDDAERRAAMRGHPDLYGDGEAGRRIVETCLERLRATPAASGSD